MGKFIDKLTAVYSAILSGTYEESGQGALEYIAIVIGLVILVYLGFKIAGVDIFNKATGFVSSVLQGS